MGMGMMGDNHQQFMAKLSAMHSPQMHAHHYNVGMGMQNMGMGIPPQQTLNLQQQINLLAQQQQQMLQRNHSASQMNQSGNGSGNVKANTGARLSFTGNLPAIPHKQQQQQPIGEPSEKNEIEMEYEQLLTAK